MIMHTSPFKASNLTIFHVISERKYYVLLLNIPSDIARKSHKEY